MAPAGECINQNRLTNNQQPSVQMLCFYHIHTEHFHPPLCPTGTSKNTTHAIASYWQNTARKRIKYKEYAIYFLE
jgi:hypothetical protein